VNHRQHSALQGVEVGARVGSEAQTAHFRRVVDREAQSAYGRLAKILLEKQVSPTRPGTYDDTA